MAKPSRRRDADGSLDPFAKRKRRYESVLRRLGLWEAFEAMPRHAREAFWKAKLPAPALRFDRSFPGGPQWAALRERLEAAPGAATVELDGVRLPSVDYFEVVLACTMVVCRTPEGLALPGPVRTFLTLARPILTRWLKEAMMPALKSIHEPLDLALHAASRLDTRVVFPELAHDACGGVDKPWALWRIRSIAAERCEVTLDGTPRGAYRVRHARPEAAGGDVSWDPSVLGRPSHAARLSVHAQAHALHQLRERVSLPPDEMFVESWLAESLEHPVIAERSGSDVLVEYRIQERKLGYLVVTPLADRVVARTFLFLTMEGTPEGRRLKQRLRLSRREAAWLGLHELSAFTRTDLKDDDVLRPLLEACGCGHLFDLAERDEFAPPEPTPLAAEVRKYLRIAA